MILFCWATYVWRDETFQLNFGTQFQRFSLSNLIFFVIFPLTLIFSLSVVSLSISLSRTPIACKLIEIFLLYCFCFHILPPHFLPSRSCSILLCCLMIKFYSSGKFVGLLFYYFLPFTVYFISVSLSLPYVLINFAIQQAQFSLPLSFTIFFSVLRNHMLELKWIMWHICKCEKCENARPVNVQRNLRLLMKTNKNGKSKFFLIKIFQRNFREIYL